MVIGRGRCWLDEEDIFAANIFIDANKNFLISEPFNFYICQRDVEDICNVLSQWVLAVPLISFMFDVPCGVNFLAR